MGKEKKKKMRDKNSMMHCVGNLWVIANRFQKHCGELLAAPCGASGSHHFSPRTSCIL